MERIRHHVAGGALIALIGFVGLVGLGTLEAAGGRGSIAPADLREWLTYIASDELEGRAVFTEGLGLAAAYLQGRLQSWGVKPGGDHGGYTQTVAVLGVKATSRSTLTVRVGNQTRTFKDGQEVTFQRNTGSKQTLTIDRVEFAGYGLDVPALKHLDYAGRDVQGSVVVYLGSSGPKGADPQAYRQLLAGRNRYALETARARAAIGPQAATARRTDAAAAERPASAPDFTTTQRFDVPLPPSLSGTDEFFEFLFSKAPMSYDALKRRAADQDALPVFRLDNVSMTFNVDTDFAVTRTQLTQNVVAVVEGSDPQLKSTYVAFGAHYDHVGYAEGELSADGQRQTPPGRVTAGATDDRIWNGADDDGSGTVALLALARAFAQGPRPKRSLLFVWHAGEERGLYGSRYFADHPEVPLDRIVAQLNVDMIGRNRDDKPSEANTVYLVGSDRISSELHAVNQEANRALSPPLRLDYELNDPSDPEQFYYRSDHYSYAAKGIPIIFFTTGLHPDYHANTDDVSKILFDKMARITQLVYETGWRVANLDHAPVRDNKGPRAGKGAAQ